MDSSDSGSEEIPKDRAIADIRVIAFSGSVLQIGTAVPNGFGKPILIQVPGR